MKIVNDSSWAKFEVGSLLSIIPGKGCTQKEINEHPGDLEVVQSTGVNNSITGLISKNYCLERGYTISEGPCLTVVGTGQGAVGYVTYHQGPVVVGNNAKLLLPNLDLDEYQMLFLATVLNVLRERFSYSDIVSIRRYSQMSIQLPVNDAGGPDWDFMAWCMKEMRERQEARLNLLSSVCALPSRQVSIDAWKDFRIDQLFTVVKGARLRSIDRTPGDIPYVGASQFNNGITHYIGNDERIHPGGVLTVCYNGPVGTTFYQHNDFWATDDVNVLYPVSKVSPEALLFIAPIIERIGSNYAYVDKWKLEDMKAANIKLPVDATGNPDWAYMESTMKTLMKQKAAEFDVLQQLLPPSEVHEAI